MGHGKMLRSSKILLHVYSLNLSVICVKDIFNVPGGIFILYISSLTLIDRFARSKPLYGDLKQTKEDSWCTWCPLVGQLLMKVDESG